jgi:hypothetical protein
MLPRHHLKEATALALALGAILPATAAARPIGPDPGFAPTATAAKPPPPAVYSRPDKATVPVTAPNAAGSAINGVPAHAAVVRVQAPQSGFDWGDAGIGAAGIVALAMFGVGGALVISQRPRQSPRG